MSFLKFKQSKKSRDILNEFNGPFCPLETIDLQCSIAAVAHNLVLSCKSCKSCKSECVSKREEEEFLDRYHDYSGYVGVISKECFMICQLDMKLHKEFSYKNILNLHIPHSTNYPKIHPYITATKWIRLRKEKIKLTVLVLSSNVGVYIYSEDGNKMLCGHEHLDSPEMVCGSIVSTQSQILVGNGKGEVHAFGFLNGKIDFRKTFSIQPESITQMYCRRNVLASGSPSGSVRVWKIKDHYAMKRCCFKTPSEECVTGLRIWDTSYIIASYGSGVVRIFNWASKRLMARIFAHSRWIVTMDFLPHNGLLLTVAEDDAAHVWKLSCSKHADSGISLKGFGSIQNIKKKIKNMQRSCKPKRKKPKISVSLDSSIHAENMLLIGGNFLNCSGTAVAIANYGVKEIYFYAKSKIASPEETNL